MNTYDVVLKNSDLFSKLNCLCSPMEMDLKLVSKAAGHVRFCGAGMNMHNMVENSYAVDLVDTYRLLML